MWYHQHIGGERCPIVDTWWQTETGAIMITPLPGITTHQARVGDAPFPGISAEILQRQGRARRRSAAACWRSPSRGPSMLRGIYGDPERYVQQVLEPVEAGIYFTGDGAKRDDDGYFWLLGRVDDVLNVAGHRIGTMEVESALVDHPKVAEAAVVGRPHEIKGQAIAAFVTLKEGVQPSEALTDELKEHVAQEDRRDRPAGRDPLRRRPAEDALGQDHAAAAARHRRGQGARRHDDAGRPGTSSRG